MTALKHQRMFTADGAFVRVWRDVLSLGHLTNREFHPDSPAWTLYGPATDFMDTGEKLAEKTIGRVGAGKNLARLEFGEAPIEILDRALEHRPVRRRAGELQIRERAGAREHQRGALRLLRRRSRVDGSGGALLRRGRILLGFDRLAFPSARHSPIIHVPTPPWPLRCSGAS
jgi:hypothetical protein